MHRAFALLLITVLPLGSVFAAERHSPTARGKALATRMCVRCHAIGSTGNSPHIGAPPFRKLDERVNLDTFVDRLQSGLTSGHPDMQTFRFTRADARALVSYLRSIEQ
jgi:cytochrome c